jgi:hypothetical protein
MASGASTLIRVSMDVSFQGGSNETIGESPTSAAGVIVDLVKSVLEASGASDQVSVDASFHGGSNDTICGQVLRRWPEIPPISPYLCHHMRLYSLTSICGGKGDDESCRLLTAAALVFSLLMSPSLVC